MPHIAASRDRFLHVSHAWLHQRLANLHTLYSTSPVLVSFICSPVAYPGWCCIGKKRGQSSPNISFSPPSCSSSPSAIGRGKQREQRNVKLRCSLLLWSRLPVLVSHNQEPQLATSNTGSVLRINGKSIRANRICTCSRRVAPMLRLITYNPSLYHYYLLCYKVPPLWFSSDFTAAIFQNDI